MAGAAHRRPQFQLVNSGGGVIEGPYQISVLPDNAPSVYGITLQTIEAWEEPFVAGPFLNFNFQQIAVSYGYRLHATFKFVAVESNAASTTYGLTLLHRLWRAMVDNQFSYGALQFQMFNGSAWRTLSPASQEWRPTPTSGKQGFYDVEIPVVSRDLVASPGEWAQSQW